MRAIQRVLFYLAVPFAIAFVTAVLTSCVSQRVKVAPQPSSQAIRKQYEQIKDRVNAGQTTQGLKQLKAFVQKYPNTDTADDAYMLMGDTYFRGKNYAEAYSAYVGIVNGEVLSPREGDAVFGASNSLYMQGKLDEALGLSERGFQVSSLPNNTRLELHRLRFQIQNQTGARLEALKTAVVLANLEPDKSVREGYRSRTLNLVESKMSTDELESISENAAYDFLRAPAHFILGSRAFEQRDFSSARSAFQQVTELAPGSDIAQKSMDFIRQIEGRRQVDPLTVGAVLPMSGRHAAIGKQAMRGLLLGLGINGDRGRSEFTLIVQDSEDNPDAARRAVEKLVLDNHVIAIAGSMTSRTAQAVAAKANELGVPNIGMSQQSNLTDIGDMVFRNALTSNMIVQQLVKTAMEKSGYRRFAILYPNDKYGVEYANLFWDEVLARGGQITAAQTYESKETDFRGVAQRLLGTFYVEDREAEYNLIFREWLSKQKTISSRKDPPDDLLPPIANFDAIFIADSTKAVGQIAPMLAYHNLKDFKLIGTNLWNNDSLLSRGEKYVEGAVFVDGISEGDPTFQKSRFYRLYKSTFEEEPTIFAAQAYDVGLMLRQTIAGGETSRSGVRDTLRRISRFEGALGPLRMSNRQELVRPLASFKVENGKIVSY